jgi:hypothetical protein
MGALPHTAPATLRPGTRVMFLAGADGRTPATVKRWSTSARGPRALMPDYVAILVDGGKATMLAHRRALEVVK